MSELLIMAACWLAIGMAFAFPAKAVLYAPPAEATVELPGFVRRYPRVTIAATVLLGPIVFVTVVVTFALCGLAGVIRQGAPVVRTG